MPILLSDRAALASPVPLITTDQARMLGIRLDSSSWLRVRNGVHVDRAAYAALPPWGKYAARVHAFLCTHPDAVLCLESAAVVHGLPRFGEARDIHLFDPDRTSSRRFGDVSVHTSRDSRGVIRLQGIHTTSILDTVVDLMRVLPPAQALAVADAAVSPAQGGTLTVDDLATRVESQQSNRGRALLRWVLARTNGLSESPAESVSRAVIEWSGFEHPELQRSFHYEGFHDRTDFFFASCGAVGESDGWQKYQLEDPREAARLLAEEKRREDRLRRNGHPFARWELQDAWRAKPLGRALSAAGVPLVSPPQSALLATLTRTPRQRHQKPLPA